MTIVIKSYPKRPPLAFQDGAIRYVNSTTMYHATNKQDPLNGTWDLVVLEQRVPDDDHHRLKEIVNAFESGFNAAHSHC